jgi:HAMP domain-containing protein
MVKIYNSLSTKLIVSFLALIVIASGASFFLLYDESKKAVLNATDDMLTEDAVIIASQINTSALMSLTPGMESSATYNMIKAQMEEMRKSTEYLANIYTVYIVNGKAYFLVVDATTSTATVAIGSEYTEINHKVFSAYSAGKAMVTDSFYTTQYGTYRSAFTPIKDANGTTVAMLGISMTAEGRIAELNDMQTTFGLIIIAIIAIAAIAVLVLAFNITRDIKKLDLAAEKISTGDMSAEVNVKRKDEVGQLAESFNRMLVSLKFETMMREEEEKAKRDQDNEKGRGD